MVEASRRAVLFSGAGLLGLAFVDTAVNAGSADAATAPAPLRSDYSAQVGKVFTAQANGVTFRMTLAHIRDLQPTTSAQQPYNFTLVFQPAQPMPEGIYTVKRYQVPTQSFLLSAVGSAGLRQAVVYRKF